MVVVLVDMMQLILEVVEEVEALMLWEQMVLNSVRLVVAQ